MFQQPERKHSSIHVFSSIQIILFGEMATSIVLAGRVKYAILDIRHS
jgi:hypothetical protein